MISRQAALDALDEIRHVLDKKEKKLTILPSAQPDHIGEVTEMVDDVISRQAMINEINLHVGILYDSPTLVESLKLLVWSLPSVQPGWIPVTERLPDVRQWVLCQCRAGIMDVLRLTADGSWSKNYPHTEYMSSFVVAWMPLPAPWEGDANG